MNPSTLSQSQKDDFNKKRRVINAFEHKMINGLKEILSRLQKAKFEIGELVQYELEQELIKIEFEQVKTDESLKREEELILKLKESMNDNLKNSIENLTVEDIYNAKYLLKSKIPVFTKSEILAFGFTEKDLE